MTLAAFSKPKTLINFDSIMNANAFIAVISSVILNCHLCRFTFMHAWNLALCETLCRHAVTLKYMDKKISSRFFFTVSKIHTHTHIYKNIVIKFEKPPNSPLLLLLFPSNEDVSLHIENDFNLMQNENLEWQSISEGQKIHYKL